MPRTRAPALALLAATALAACGSGAGSRSTATSAPAATAPLARQPKQAGELVFSGQSSPQTHGPLRLDGSYLVRFEQFAPEDPSIDFGAQTPFTASLERRAGDPQGAIKLFGAAARSGRRTLSIHGRYVLDVSFGDFPYAVRFTPR